ncbi:MAG: preprotein translocase subunit YajC [Rhodospirillaceae bacterium]|nr:preprotein translocase subunit YajC [Rhodospirillaceae bacterium]
MFVSPAFAQAAGDAAAPGLFESLIPFLLIFVVFYFLLIRPQQKKAKDHKSMQSSIRRGDKIVTSGGIFGSVVRVKEDEGVLEVEIAEGVKVKVDRSMVSAVLVKTEPADKASKDDPKGGGGAKDDDSKSRGSLKNLLSGKK